MDSGRGRADSYALLVSVLRTLGRLTYAAGRRTFLASALGALLLAGCGSSRHRATTSPSTPTSTLALAAGQSGGGHPGVVNVYSADAAGDLSPVVRGDPALVYVPNSLSNTVDVISQRTLKIVAQFPVGALPQHVTPSYDLRTLYVDNDLGNSLTPIDPRTAKPGRPIPVEDPYNLYFTPDGRFAIVVAERLQRLDFRDPNTMRLVHSLPVPECRGVDHMDFSADGRYAFASCEFAGRMIEIDLSTQQVIRTLEINNGVCEPAGREAVPRRPHPLHRRSAERRPVGDRPVLVPRDRLPADGRRRPRPLPEPRRAGSCTSPTARRARSRWSASGRGA